MTLLVLALLATAQCCIAVQQQALPEAPETYLFPILKNGPYNQKRDLRKFLAVAKELGCGIVLTGIFKHYLDLRHRDGYALDSNSSNSLLARSSPGPAESTGRNVSTATRSAADPSHSPCFSETVQGYMRFEDIIDRSEVNKWVPTVTVQELRATGWSGIIDAVIYPKAGKKNVWAQSLMYINRSIRAEPGVSLPPTVPRLAINEAFTCTYGATHRVREAMQPYRVVAVMQSHTGDNRGPDLKTQPGGVTAPGTTCQQTFHQANRILRPATWIQRAARAYRKDRTLDTTSTSDPASLPYLAVHVRPYPDQCVERWLPGKFDPRANTMEGCTKQHTRLHHRLGACVAERMARHNLTEVFIMTHPAIWPTVKSMMDEAGVKNAWHVDLQQLTHMAECEDNSATFLTMVEEEIAVQSCVFLGTYWSSITHAIVYTRLGLNMTDNAYIEQC